MKAPAKKPATKKPTTNKPSPNKLSPKKPEQKTKFIIEYTPNQAVPKKTLTPREKRRTV